MKSFRFAVPIGQLAVGLAILLSLLLTMPALSYDPSPHGQVATCPLCHDPHNGSVPSGNAFCTTCHNGTKARAVSTHTNKQVSGAEQEFELQCLQCHIPHGSSNLSLVRTFVRVLTSPLVTTGPVTFTATSGLNSFDDNSSVATSRICVTCHINSNNPGYTMTNHPGGANHLGGTNYGGQNCATCHSHANGFMHGGGTGTGCGSAGSCHGARQSHATHISGQILSLTCAECHNTASFPQFKDGATTKAATTVCANCHTTNGIALAKQYWDNPGSSSRAAGSWAVVEGDKSYCGSCHDATPGKTQGDGTGNTAFNILGDDSTFGYYVTGHGKQTGNYVKLSHQEAGVNGNPAANLWWCSSCHDLQAQHFGNSTKRLLPGFENSQSNNNCNNCHPPGTSAVANPRVYTNSSDFEGSAHGGKLCTQCHDVHGVAGNFAGMTKANKQNLCDQCHSGAGGHPGVGATAFTVGGKNYTLQCVSCHNVHIVTGKYSQANQNKSPVTRFADITNVWGDVAGEKMNAYAGTGTYRTPSGESFSGAQLPDYATFCLDCHGEGGPTNVPFGINWSTDPHGKQSANQPNGYGTCPNWFACGKAFGWDNDDCVASDKNTCWPVIPRGAGDQLFSRETYTHTARVAGANFTLSCTDCHTGHGTGNLGRAKVNGGSFTGNWNNMCNNCHYYYSDWHAGMSCGNASCHVSPRMNTSGVGSASTPHQMNNASGSGGTRTFNPDLVLNYRFENNLKDSGGGQMDGKWFSTTGSFAPGKSGQAAVLGEDITVQVGTENSYWSTDAGYHGTWVYTEMKFNTTLEAWVYPTDNSKTEYTIFRKHTGIDNGGYGLSLTSIGGSLKATFNMQSDNNGVAQDGRAGIRGAYSSVSIPLNTWTHIAATFDKNGPDRNPTNPAIGRIRIYVNGEDVTTSDASGNNRQPGANETSIFSYSENSPWNQSICFDGHWCASEFSIGGFDWESTNFIGRIDEVKVWNTTKDAAYFAALDSQTAPFISSVEGLIGSRQLKVTFSEGVFTNNNQTGALTLADFNLTDTNGNNPRSIQTVAHTPGSATAIITMTVPLVTADVNADTLAAVANSIFDNYGNAAGTSPIIIGLSSQCPTYPVSIPLNEPAGSSFIMDSQNILYGIVNGTSTLTGSAYSGNALSNYIDFPYNSACLDATKVVNLETRIKPTGLDGTANYIRRILSRGNYQISVWRNNSFGSYSAPSGTASIALWVNVANSHGGNAWKPVLTNYSTCPIVSDNWYKIRLVWNTDKPGGTPGQFFVPADIFIDDQGTDGNGAGERWSGEANCTKSDQSYHPDASKLYTADEITPSTSAFVLGADINNRTGFVFNGLIDWLTINHISSIHSVIPSPQFLPGFFFPFVTR